MVSGGIIAGLGVGGRIVGRFVNDAVVVVGVSVLVISINHVFGDSVVVSFLHKLSVGSFVVNRLMNHFMVHNWFVVEGHLSVFSDNVLLDGFFDNFLNIADRLSLGMLRVCILVGSHVSVRVLAINHVVGGMNAAVVARVVLGQLNLNINVVHADLSSVHGRDALFLHGFFNDPPSVVRSVLVGCLPVRIVDMSSFDGLSLHVMFNYWHFHGVRMMVYVVVGRGRVMLDRLGMFDQNGLLDYLVVHNRLLNNMRSFSMVRFLLNIDDTLSVMSMVVEGLMMDGLLVLVSVHMMDVLLDNGVIVIISVLLFPILERRLFVSFQETFEVNVAIKLALVVRVVIRQVNSFVDGVLDPRMRRHVVLVVIMMVQFVVNIMVHDGDWSFMVFNMRVNHIRVVFWLVVSIRVTIDVRLLHNNRLNMHGLFMTHNCFVVDNRFANDVHALLLMMHWLSFDLFDDSVRVFVHHGRLDHLSSVVFNHGRLSLLSHSVCSFVSRFVVIVDWFLNNVGAIVGLSVSRVVVSLIKDFLDEFELAVPVCILCGVVLFTGVVCWSSQINGVFFRLVVARRMVTVVKRLLNFVHDLVR